MPAATKASNTITGITSLALALALLLPLALTAITGVIPLKNLPPPPNPSLSPILANATEYDLRTAAFPSLFHLFLSLPPPSPPLHGEYLAEILDAGNLPANVLGWIGFTPFFPGAWVGKSFVKEGGGEGGEEEGGFGYNVFRVSGDRVDRRFRVKTSVVPSVWDGKMSFQLQYGEERHLLGALQM